MKTYEYDKEFYDRLMSDIEYTKKVFAFERDGAKKVGKDIYKEIYVKFKKLVVYVMSILYRIEATGVENIPKDTNYMLVGNHLHIMDAGLITKYDDSYLRFLVNNKLYKKNLKDIYFKNVAQLE